MDSSSVYALHAAQRKPLKEEDNSKRTAITRVTREYNGWTELTSGACVRIPSLTPFGARAAVIPSTTILCYFRVHCYRTTGETCRCYPLARTVWDHSRCLPRRLTDHRTLADVPRSAASAPITRHASAAALAASSVSWRSRAGPRRLPWRSECSSCPSTVARGLRPIDDVELPFWGCVQGIAGFADTPVWDNCLNAISSADRSRLQSLEAQMHSMRALLQDVVSAVCPEIRGSRE